MLSRPWPPPDYPHTNDFGVAYHKAIGDGWRPTKHPVAVVDLSADVWGNLSYNRRRDITWGRKNMAWEFGGHLIPLVKDFHAEVAGRVTRPDASWWLMMDEIDAGNGDCIIGRYNGDIAAASVFIDGGPVSIYWTGVYDRKLFPRPLAHYSVWQGITRSAERGVKFVELGEVPERGTVSDKEYNIGQFKRKFATGYVHAMNAEDTPFLEVKQIGGG